MPFHKFMENNSVIKRTLHIIFLLNLKVGHCIHTPDSPLRFNKKIGHHKKTEMNKEHIQKFSEWFDEELNRSTVRIKTACCLSTIGTDGFPNARFVSLKDISDEGFIVTGTVSSKKGVEIELDNKVALTFWWTETEKQVRVQGKAEKISDQQADYYFNKRNKESQIVSTLFYQGEKAKDYQILKEKFELAKTESNSQTIKRPEKWSGYLIKPERIEFLEFKPNRFNKRILFELENVNWTKSLLQP